MSWNGSDSVGSAPRADRNDQTPPNRGRGEKCAAESAAFGGKVAKQSRSDAQAPAPARPHKPRSANHASRSTLHGLAAGLLVVALGGAAVWWFFGRDGSRPLPAERTTSPQPPPVAQSGTKKSYIPPAKRAVVKTGDKLKDALAAVEAQGELVKIAPPPEAPKDARTREQPKRVFKTGAEQLLGWLVSVEPGDMPMPIPPMDELDRANLVNILLSKNEIADDDSDRIAMLKQDVDYCKKEMIKFIKEGGDPDDFMQYYFQQLHSAFETHNEVLNQYYDLKEEDSEMARQFLRRANKLLEEKGIKRVRGDDGDGDEPEPAAEGDSPQPTDGGQSPTTGGQSPTTAGEINKEAKDNE